MPSAMASLSLPSSGFLQRDLGRLRSPAGFLPRGISHGSVLRASLKFHTRELPTGYTLFTFFLDDEEDDVSTSSGSHPVMYHRAAAVELPPRRPSSFIKASPVFPQQRRQNAQLAEMKERILNLSEVSTPSTSRVATGVPRLPSAFRKPSPVTSSVGRNAFPLKQRSSRHRTKATRAVGLLPLKRGSNQSFQKRSPIADSRVRDSRRKVERDVLKSKDSMPRVVPAASAVPRLPSNFMKRSPVLDFLSRQTGGVLKDKALGRPRTPGSQLPTTQLPARPPSLFKKHSPVVSFRLRAIATLQRPFASRALVVPSSMSTQGGTDEESPLATPQNIPERQPSSFRRRRRPLPSSQDQVPLSQVPIQSEPNGSQVYNRLPRAIPLTVQTPALMDGWSAADSAADGLSFSVDTSATQQPLQSDTPSSSLLSSVLDEPESAAGLEPSLDSGEEAESQADSVAAVLDVTGSTDIQVTPENKRRLVETLLAGMTVADLREKARSSGLRGFSKLKKADLIQLLLDNINYNE